MQIGDVVFTRSIKSYFGNDKVKGHSGFSAHKGRMLVFVCLGSCDESEMNEFDAVDVLKAGGWTPPAAAPSPEERADGE